MLVHVVTVRFRAAHCRYDGDGLQIASNLREIIVSMFLHDEYGELVDDNGQLADGYSYLDDGYDERVAEAERLAEWIAGDPDSYAEYRRLIGG